MPNAGLSGNITQRNHGYNVLTFCFKLQEPNQYNMQIQKVNNSVLTFFILMSIYNIFT